MNGLFVLGVLLGCVSCTVAHMSMQYPFPRDTLNGANYLAWEQNEPMWSVHPSVCHGLDEDSSIRSGNALAAGDVIEIDLYGTVPHDGGHCSFWWTTDTSSDWHKIIDIVDCTLADSFSVMLPYTMSTDCQSKCTFAFSWSPYSSSHCEIYMNCADISVSGVTGISSTDTDITVSFQNVIDGATCERADTTTHYTPTFGTIKTDYTNDDQNLGGMVAMDTEAIEDEIEDDTDAMCPNLNADNLDGTIDDDGTCGKLCHHDSCRCDDGECCSAAGYCGPEVAYYDESAGEYVYYHYGNGVSYYDDASQAISDYCDNNQGDWRLVSCSSSDAAGTGGTANLRDAAKMAEGTADSTITNGAIQVGHVMIGALLMQVVCLFVAFLG